MLELNLISIIRAKGFTQPQSFLRKKGFTAREARSFLQATGVKQVRDRSIQRLCEALVCEPNDLFRWSGDPTHALAALNGSAEDLVEMQLVGKPQEEVESMVGQMAAAIANEEVSVVNAPGRLFLNIGRVLAQRQQSHPHAFLNRNGFTSMEASKLLGTDRVAVKVRMLTRLCVFFGCTPNDLFDWDGSESHFLNVLRKEPVVDIREQLAGLPLSVALRLLKGIP